MIGASARSDERLPQVPERTVLIQQAFRLEWLTVAWMIIEALVAIGSGVIAGSLTLTAFGLDSVIELISATVLIWRLTEELRRGEEFSRHAERIASRSGGALLFVLAAYIVLGAAWSLWTHHGGEFSVTGLIVAAVAIPIMYMLALAKVDARKGRIVELRFFGGLTVEETAEVLEISEETVTRDWRVARTWLFRELARTKARG